MADKIVLRSEYPRPQFKRDDYFTLNGEWEFTFDDNGDGVKNRYYTGEPEFDRKITVPFAYQTKMSGIGSEEVHDTVWYKRRFDVDTSRGVLLCFNACDYITEVYVNGKFAVANRGGYTPFSADITDLCKKKDNVIVVKCYDPLDFRTLRGKQSCSGERHGCWYIPTTGIWQSVWIEYFDKNYICDYELTPDYDKKTVSGVVEMPKVIGTTLKVDLSYDGKKIKSETFKIGGKIVDYKIDLLKECESKAIKDWDLREPNLVYVDFTLYGGEKVLDRAHTRFGFRKIEIKGDKILLNGKPLYQKLILDQGYWKDSALTAPSIDEFRNDIAISMQMGFNGARKHQKFEDPYYYYFADEMGFLVWCEMPSAYSFNDVSQLNLISEWTKIVKCAKVFTSVISYIPLNESWGLDDIGSNKREQDFSRALFYATKSLDPSRIVPTNDGWETLTESDTVNIHDYSADATGFKERYKKENYSDIYNVQVPSKKIMIKGNKYNGQPVMMTEFGGYAMKTSIDDKNWGYGEASANKEDFYRRVDDIVKGIRELDMVGYCYTQLTDVQQEVNGLLDENHKPKFDIKRINEIFSK